MRAVQWATAAVDSVIVRQTGPKVTADKLRKTTIQWEMLETLAWISLTIYDLLARNH